MNFNKTSISLLICSLLSSSYAMAQSDPELLDFIKNKKVDVISSPMNKKLLPINPTIFKNSIDKNLVVASFNWNNGKIKNIPLDKSLEFSPQYDKALDNYFKQVASVHGANKLSLSEVNRKALHNTGRGAIIAKYQQRVDGLDVFGRTINIMINRKNEFVASSGYFSSQKNNPSFNYNLSSADALSIGFYENTGKTISSLVLDKQHSNYTTLSSSIESGNNRLTENSRVKKVFFPIANEELVSAYYVEAETSVKGEKSSQWFSYVIDGNNGKVLFKNNLTAHVATTYKIFAETTGNHIPFDGPQGNALTPHPTGEKADTPAVGDTFVSENTVTLDHAGLSTNDPWLSASETTTRGNNVDSYADISGEDGFDAEDVRAEMTSSNAFEYDFGQFSAGLTGDAQKHAVVNLFYVNNFLHDWFYDSGFNEQAGNAQVSNFGRGGNEGDALNVEAQDSSGTNNANMSTPADGSSPRMQMFLWTFLSDSSVTVDGISNIDSLSAGFGPSDYDVSGVMSLVDDGVSPEGDACETITTDLAGKIAIIDRGDCNFTVKVKGAQEQGAVGVIMVNNVEGDPIVQGGEDDTVTIPSMMVTISKGTEIKDALALDDTLSVRLFNQPKPIDGTLDNGIVAHEWGHYLSNRLVGNANGLSNNQGRSMGEGWSDFVALLMMVKESDNLVIGNENFQGLYSASTFVGDAYDGIRRAPYTTDMNKNALTFKHIENGVPLPTTHPVSFGASGSNNAEVHASGEVWANTLWEAYVALINRPSSDFLSAQQDMKDYLVAGLKLTPNAPTMIEARNALLAASLANNSDDFELIRAAFSKRGMGASAFGPNRTSSDHSGVVEDFTSGVDLISSLEIDASSFDINACDQDGVLDVGETATLNLSFKNYSASSIPTFNVTLSSADDVSFDTVNLAVDSIANFGGVVNKSVEVTVNNATFMQNITVSVEVDEIGSGADDFIEPQSISASVLTNFDFSKVAFNDDMSVQSASEFDWSTVKSNSVNSFVVENSRWYGVDSGSAGTSDLITPEIRVASSGALMISFDHFYLFEASDDQQGVFTNWDGGVIEVSVNGGNWQDVVDFGATLDEPYNGVLASSTEALSGRNAYVFTRDVNSSNITQNQVTFPEGLVNGKDIKVRFRIGTDANTEDFGWLIDNVVVTNAVDPLFSEIVAEDNVCLIGNAPQVDAGEDILIISRDNSDISVTLSGTATDADNDSLTFSWVQRLGEAVTLSNAGTLNPSFTVASPTENVNYSFELIADDGGQTRSDIVEVSINLNQAPTATASGGSVTEGGSFTLSSTSSDPENDNLTFSWTQTSGPTVTLSDSSVSSPSFTAPQVDGTTILSFELVVSDGALTSNASVANVTITNVVAPEPEPEPEPVSSGSGGGSFSLLLLSLMAIGRGFLNVKRK